MQVACFAIGNLPPETVKGWPYLTLRAAAQTMSTLPDFTPADAEMAIEWVSFSREVERFELPRQKKL